MSGNAFAKIAWKSEHTRRSAGSGSKNADISEKGRTDGRTDGHNKVVPVGLHWAELGNTCYAMQSFHLHTDHHDKPPTYPLNSSNCRALDQEHRKLKPLKPQTARSRGMLWTLSSTYSLISA